MAFSDRRMNQLYTITAILSMIALVFQFVIVFTYIRFRNLRKKSFEMVFILAICSIFANASYLIQNENETGSAICTAQGFLLNFWNMAMFVWATWIAYCLYCSIVLQKSTPSRILMHAMTWGWCIGCSVVPIITGSYGNAGPWCWIKDGDTGSLLRFVCFYIPLWIGFFISLILYSSVARTLKRFAAMADMKESLSNASSAMTAEMELKGNAHHDRLLRMATHLSWYPLIFIVAWFANTLIRIVQAVDPSTSSSYTLAFIHVLCDGTFYQSMGNVFAYGLNGPVKKEWRELYGRMSRERSIWPLFSFESSDTEDRGDDFEMRGESEIL